jgi:hypothetical protein
MALEKSKLGFSIGKFIFNNWYWFLLLIFILPAIISSLQIAFQTNNPSYPFLVLGTKLFTADAAIQKDVNLLETDPAKLIGMEKPTTGLWKTTVYWWRVFWNVWYD